MTVHSLSTHERERFVEDLLGYMTREEKLGQLNLSFAAAAPGLEATVVAGLVGGVVGADNPQRLQGLATERSRLGIPLLLTARPTRPALSPWVIAATWDEALARKLGAAAAETALRTGANALTGPLITLADKASPLGDAHVATSEPHLAARLAAAFAGGARGRDAGGLDRALAIPALVAEPGLGLQWALDVVGSGDVLAVDCAAFGREAALKAGFSGLLLAECRRISAILADHFATTSARSPVEAADKAIADGRVSDLEIDRAVRGVLAVKHALGLFRRPERTIQGFRADGDIASPAEIARRSMVLLRNEAGLLPFSPVSDRVLVVGTAEGAGGACSEALGRAGIGHSRAPGLAIRREDEPWLQPIAGDHFALSLTRDAAQRSDFVLVVLDDRHFAASGGAAWRRPTPAVLAMLRALSAAGSRLAAIVATDDPVDLADADQHFAAVLQCWKPGPGFAEALADVLSGRHGPQGRMPATAGRFAFGHGLGFGESVFSSYTLAPAGDHLVASVRVRNAGNFPTRETVQVYVRSQDGSLRLAGFEHVTLAPGEDVPVRFELGVAALGTVNSDGRLEVRPGSHEVHLGKSAARLFAATVNIDAATARAMSFGGTSMLRAMRG